MRLAFPRQVSALKVGAALQSLEQAFRAGHSPPTSLGREGQLWVYKRSYDGVIISTEMHFRFPCYRNPKKADVPSPV